MKAEASFGFYSVVWGPLASGLGYFMDLPNPIKSFIKSSLKAGCACF